MVQRPIVDRSAEPPKVFVCEISESGVSLCSVDITTRNIATVNGVLKNHDDLEKYLLAQDLPCWKQSTRSADPDVGKAKPLSTEAAAEEYPLDFTDAKLSDYQYMAGKYEGYKVKDFNTSKEKDMGESLRVSFTCFGIGFSNSKNYQLSSYNNYCT